MNIVKADIDALLITDFYAILYLTGFQTLSPHEYEAKLLVTPTHVFLITDVRYQSAAEEYFADTDIQVRIHTSTQSFLQVFKNLLATTAVTNVGFESDRITYAFYETLQEQLHPVICTPTKGFVMKLREVKESSERALMKAAAKHTVQCLTEMIPFLKTGVTERTIVHRMESWIRAHDISFSFEPIVAFDTHSALPHYNSKTSEGVLTDNSIILIDMGISYQGYCSDISRVFFHGTPRPEQANAYAQLLTIQQNAVKQAVAGTRMSLIDSTAREALIQHGYPSIPHSIGHGIGLEVHEGFTLSPKSSGTLKSGMVCTIEPGIYIEGKWGMRIEDTIAVGKKNTVLTQFDRKLISI